MKRPFSKKLKPIRVFNIRRKQQTRLFKRKMLVLKYALAQEKVETKEMLAIYKKYTQGHASKREMKIANEQFFDLVKGLGLGIFAVLPFSPITIPIALKLGKIVGVDILPSAFKKNDTEQKLHDDTQ